MIFVSNYKLFKIKIHNYFVIYFVLNNKIYHLTLSGTIVQKITNLLQSADATNK